MNPRKHRGQFPVFFIPCVCVCYNTKNCPLCFKELSPVFVLFAVGLVSASFLAACVLPLTSAFVIREAFGWEAGVGFSFKEAPQFRSIVAFVIVFFALVVLIPNINLMGAMLFAQLLNGIILPVLLVLMALIAADNHVTKSFVNGRVTSILLWATVAIVTILTVILLVMQALGLG